MSVRFTSGNVGRLTFEHANRMADATDAVESMPTGDRIATVPIRPDFIVARLTSKAGMTLPPNSYEVWNWVEVGVTGTRAARSIAPIPKGLEASGIGEMPIGRAISLGGTASSGDVVFLFPMKDETGESWYGFAGMVGGTTLLEIIGSQLSGAMSSGNRKVWIYTVEMRKAKIDGLVAVFEPIAGSQQAKAINLYETSALLGAWGHGQPLEFNQLGELEPQPIEGYVLGLLTDPGQGSIPPTYVFEASNPMIPECQTEAEPSNAGQFLKRGL